MGPTPGTERSKATEPKPAKGRMLASLVSKASQLTPPASSAAPCVEPSPPTEQRPASERVVAVGPSASAASVAALAESHSRPMARR